MSIYKPCDIRGDAGTELSPDLYRSWGRCLGQDLSPGSTFVVGGDVRESTPAFLAALAEGAAEAGLEVLDLGIVPTPMVYFARQARQAAGCAIVTASHNPPAMNGLKWMIGDMPTAQQDVRRLQARCESGTATVAGRAPGRRRLLDIAEEYERWIADAFVDAAAVRCRVILDPGNGAWSGRAVKCLHQAFPEADISAIHDHADGRFPDRDPDCSQARYLGTLARAVSDTGADLGVAFDGDGDRVAFVDGEGTALTAEESTYVLLHSFGDELQGQGFVEDLKFSDRVADAARDLGARVLSERSGHAFIRARMINTGALFGAEVSGHYFYRQLGGGDDGLYSACRMIRYLGTCGQSLATLRRLCPPVFMTPDLRVAIESSRQPEVIRFVRTTFGQYPQSQTDGVRVDFPSGWALMRSSVTEPKLTFRFEGDSPEGLEQIVRTFCEHLPEMGDELYRRYRQAAGQEAS